MKTRSGSLFTPVLFAGCLILLVGFGIRNTFGVFQIPIADDLGWLRTEFSLAIAIQNLAWGIGQPMFAAFAEKFSDRKAIIVGALCYALGLVLSSMAISPLVHQLLGIVIGFGVAGTGFGVILAVVGRSTSDENRSMALGIATAAGSVGQIFGPPIADSLLNHMPWPHVFVVFSVSILMVLLLLPVLDSGKTENRIELEQSMSEILSKTFRDPSYAMIFFGFFSCGFQLAFITAHFPAYIAEMCTSIPQNSVLRSMGIVSTSALGAFSIAIIGAANVLGTVVSGILGKYFTKKYLLSLIYLCRTIAALLFIMNPMTPDTVVIFSIVMGALWLATVPLTSGLVAYIYGLKYMGTLFGIVFFSHQLGGFFGVWLGGLFYDKFGSYELVWWVGIGVGAFSAVIHLPVRELPIGTKTSILIKEA